MALKENTTMTPGTCGLKKHTAVKTGRDGCEKKNTQSYETRKKIGLELKIPNALAVC